MKNIEKSIFNLQRFMILQTKVNPQTCNQIPDDYAFAWYVKLYPFFHDAELHEDLEEFFKITKHQVDKVSKYLDDEWLAGRLYTFYELEDKYNCRNRPEDGIDRMVLLDILKYIKLHGGFDDDFWNKILEPMKHPAEARYISREFSADEIYFV
jgi:hypothetical protein